MGIAKHKPSSEPTPGPELPLVQSPEFKGVVYDDDNIPLTSLIAFVEGSPWTVDYFSQVIGKDNDIREVDVGQSASYQQYKLIKKFELRVTSALTSSYDSSTGFTTVQGTANMLSVVIPNANDYFVAEAGEKLLGIFKIDNVERKALSRESVYEVSYKLQCYVVQQPGTYEDLKKKVVRTYVFDKNRLVENLQPLLKTDDYNNVTNLYESYFEFVKYYFRTFFNQRYYMLLVPGQESSIYDPFLMDYILKIVDIQDAPEIRNCRKSTTTQDPYLTQPQLFMAMYEKDHSLLAQCNKEMDLMHRQQFFRNSFFGGFALNAVAYMVYPKNPDFSANVNDMPIQKLSENLISLVPTDGDHGSTPLPEDNQYEHLGETIPLIKPANTDGCYVLSNEFYQDGPNLSVLEILTRDYLKGSTINMSMLIAIQKAFRGWRRLDQFYYGPIILTLFKEARRATYTS